MLEKCWILIVCVSNGYYIQSATAATSTLSCLYEQIFSQALRFCIKLVHLFKNRV